MAIDTQGVSQLGLQQASVVMPGTINKTELVDSKQTTEKSKFEPQIKEIDFKRTVEEINQALHFFENEVRLKVHSATNRVIIQIVDSKTEQVIKEIPPQKILDLVLKLEELLGLLIDEKR